MRLKEFNMITRIVVGLVKGLGSRNWYAKKNLSVQCAHSSILTNNQHENYLLTLCAILSIPDLFSVQACV